MTSKKILRQNYNVSENVTHHENLKIFNTVMNIKYQYIPYNTQNTMLLQRKISNQDNSYSYFDILSALIT